MNSNPPPALLCAFVLWDAQQLRGVLPREGTEYSHRRAFVGQNVGTKLPPNVRRGHGRELAGIFWGHPDSGIHWMCGPVCAISDRSGMKGRPFRSGRDNALHSSSRFCFAELSVHQSFLASGPA